VKKVKKKGSKKLVSSKEGIEETSSNKGIKGISSKDNKDELAYISIIGFLMS
jgi:hypothetical protein